MTRIRHALQRFFDLRPEEWPRFRLLFLTYVLFTVGLQWAVNTIRAEIVTISSEFLSQSQFISAVAVILVSIVYTIYVDKISKDRMFMIVTIVGAGLALLALPLTLDATLQRVGYLALWIVYQLLFYIWVIHWGTYIIDFYDTRAARRVFLALGIARPVGTMLAGALYSFITYTLAFDTPQIVILWAASLALVALLLWVISRESQLNETTLTSGIERTASSGAANTLREGLRHVFGSSFLRWMAFSALVVIAINTLTEYYTSTLFKEALINAPDPARAIGNATATLDALGNLAGLLIQLFIFASIMKRFDLGTVNLIYPLLVLLTTGGLVAAPGMVTAGLAYINYTALRRVFRDPAIALLYNGVPAQAKGRARAVINGLISPAGTLIAAGLQGLIPLMSGNWFLPSLLVGSAVLYFITMLVLRREYAQAMVKMLESQSFGYLFSRLATGSMASTELDAHEIGVTDRTRLDMLLKQLRESDDPHLKTFLISLIVDTGGKDAVPVLCDLARRSDPELRMAALRELVAERIRAPEAQTVLEDALNDPDEAVRELAARGLSQTIDRSAFLPTARRLLTDSSPAVRGLAISALLASRGDDRQTGESALGALLNENTSAAQLAAITALMQMGGANAIPRLLPLLQSDDEAVRYGATQAINRLWGAAGRSNLPEAIFAEVMRYAPLLLHDPVERVRIAELGLLRHIPTPEAYAALADALRDPNPRVRTAAVEALVAVGRPVISVVHPLMDDGVMVGARHKTGETAPPEIVAQTAAMILSRIDPARYKESLTRFIDRHVDMIYANIARLIALGSFREYPSVTILKNVLRDENERLLDEIFDLLGGAEADDSLKIIRESLANRDSRVRANAVEALEALTTPQTARILAPLCDPALSLAQMAAFDPDPEREQLQPFYVLYRSIDDMKRNMALAGSLNWLRAVVLYALAEIGQTHPELSKYLPEDERELPTYRVKLSDRQIADDEVDIISVLSAIRYSLLHPDGDIRGAARGAMRVLRGQTLIGAQHHKPEKEGEAMLSIVERMILLKRVSIFDSLPVDRLRVLAGACTERLYTRDSVIFRKGAPGDELYIVVEGEVNVGLFDLESENGDAINEAGNGSGAFTRLATYTAGGVFGEMTLFHGGKRSATAVAATDVIMLALRGGVLTALLHQYPDIAVELLAAFSDRLRVANEQLVSGSAVQLVS